MQIQSTLKPQARTFQAPAPKQEQAQESWLPTKDEVKLGASMLGGGLALGAGGMYLGAEVGMAVASKMIEGTAAGQPAPIALLTIFATLPAAIAYTAVGAAIGGAVGGAAGGALGYSAYNHFSNQ